MSSKTHRWAQWLANRKAKVELNGYVEATLIQNDLARINTSLTARIDALETYVNMVTEKYMKQMATREARALKKEAELIVEPITGFETIRQKYGGRE